MYFMSCFQRISQYTVSSNRRESAVEEKAVTGINEKKNAHSPCWRRRLISTVAMSHG
jgi:hypothetical protein